MSTLKRKAGASINGNDAKKPKADGNITAFFGAPKPKTPSAVAEAPAPKFNKEKWVDGLTPEQKELLQLEIDTLDVSWLAHLKDQIITKEFLGLKKYLKQETDSGQKVFPPPEDVYSWSRHTPFNDVKVVIVGQDPYHNNNQAHGMAFSVRPPTVAPPSLKNMYIALKKDYPTFVPPPNNSGLLIPWADRGVLMLNTCLTVRAHKAYSHANHGWESFTQKVIDLIAQKRTRGVVYLAWGSHAAKTVQKVDRQRHLILQCAHPSPLSAHRGFLDCGHFKKANDWLVNRYGDDGEIDWALAPTNSTKVSKKVDPKSEEKVAKNNELEKEVEKNKIAEPGDEFNSDDEEALAEVLQAAEDDVKKSD